MKMSKDGLAFELLPANGAVAAFDDWLKKL